MAISLLKDSALNLHIYTYN